MKRLKDYHERSNKISSDCTDEELIKNAREEIFSGLTDSVGYLKGVRSNSKEKTENRIKAAVEHCKLAGLYSDKVEHSGNIKFEPCKIFRGDE